MKYSHLLLLPLVAIAFPFAGCKDLKEAGSEAVNAPSDYVGANVRAKQQAEVTSATTTINKAVQMFSAAEGRNPSSLEELTREGYLQRLPDLPDGASFNYDAASGQVTVEGY